MKNTNIAACCLLGMISIAEAEAKGTNDKNDWNVLATTIAPNILDFLHIDIDNDNNISIPSFNETFLWGNHEYNTFIKDNNSIGIETNIGENTTIGLSFNHKNGAKWSTGTGLPAIDALNNSPTASIYFHYGDDTYSSNLSISTGILGKNTGLLISTGFSYNETLTDNLSGSASVNVNLADRSYMSDLLGLQDGETPIGRTAYSGNSSILNYGFNLGLNYQVHQKHSLLFSTSIGTSINEDYINNVGVQAAITMGYTYKF